MSETKSELTPETLLEQDETLMPDMTGYPTHLRESVFSCIIAIWEYIHENDIDPSDYESEKEFEQGHRDNLGEYTDDKELNMFQVLSAIQQALKIEEQGFTKWRNQHYLNDVTMVEWEPATEFEWTEEKKAEDVVNQLTEGHPMHEEAVEKLDNEE